MPRVQESPGPGGHAGPGVGASVLLSLHSDQRQVRAVQASSEINDSICFYRKDGKCPVTGLPLMEEDLIRLFWPEK